MKSHRLPAGLYNKWLEDYRKKYPHIKDTWHKYQYLHQRTIQYLNKSQKINRAKC